MSRRKLTEYLNDPSLLHSISIDELRSWAEQAPYAGLINKLIVQKLLLSNASEKELNQATALAILSNANPGVIIKSIEDFKKMILSGSFSPIRETESGKIVLTDAHSVSDVEKELNVEESADIDQERSRDAEAINSDNTNSKQSIVDSMSEDTDLDSHLDVLTSDDDVSTDSDVIEGQDFELSEFSRWLSTLKPLKDNLRQDQEDFKLKNKMLASDALAELLVEQGHYDEAIEMYELLMLKNPQKSSFFAAQIQKLKTL